MADDWIIEQEGDTLRLVAPSGAEIVAAEHDPTLQGRMLFRLARDVALARAAGVKVDADGCAAHGLAHPCEACAATLPYVEFLEHWTHEGHLQTFEDRERFRKAARELIGAPDVSACAAIKQPVAWRREWDGDESDLGHWLYTEDEAETKDGHHWHPLFLQPPTEAEIRAGLELFKSIRDEPTSGVKGLDGQALSGETLMDSVSRIPASSALDSSASTVSPVGEDQRTDEQTSAGLSRLNGGQE